MAKLNQPGTDYGTKGETGEKLRKGVTSSDMTGQRKAPLNGGVGMGKADKLGNMEGAAGRAASDMGKQEGHCGEFNSGKSESTCYDHKRLSHAQSK